MGGLGGTTGLGLVVSCFLALAASIKYEGPEEALAFSSGWDAFGFRENGFQLRLGPSEALPGIPPPGMNELLEACLRYEKSVFGSCCLISGCGCIVLGGMAACGGGMAENPLVDAFSTGALGWAACGGAIKDVLVVDLGGSLMDPM